MNTTMTKHDDRAKANALAKANTSLRFSTPDRTTATPTARPTIDDDDAQWVTQRMFDHYNG